jgi:hypothetical protein
MEPRLPYGWRDFDPEIVEAIVARDHAHVVPLDDGHMTCPPLSHDREPLGWRELDYKNGTEPHGHPEVSFRVTPTYILSDRASNFIVGHELVAKLLDGAYGKAEVHRLGHEHSEDALTWSVFRSLQEAQLLHLLVPLLSDTEAAGEPELFLSGRKVLPNALEEWEQLAEARKHFEPTHDQQTEPDAVLHVPGWGWVFIEAKFGAKVTAPANPDKMRKWLELYPRKADRVLQSPEVLAKIEREEFPEQLLRNIVFADRLRQETGEHAHVVLLARAKEETKVEDRVARCLTADADVTFSRLSWEQVYKALPSDPKLATLRHYLENKSYRLQRAFEL